MQGSTTAKDFILRFKEMLHASLLSPEVRSPALPADHRPQRDVARRCALLLLPHPDDECLMGGLPLRLKQENGWQIIAVAMSLGSKVERRAERWAEMTKSCVVLGFDMLQPVEDGFSELRKTTREQKLDTWLAMVERTAALIREYKPDAVFMPHARDMNDTHIGVHWLGMDALAAQVAHFECHVVQTEFWQPNEAANCMVGVKDDDVATLLSGLCCHAGENSRNPFHLRFPAYLTDNVRRGSELVAGKGAPAAPMDFAMLYRIDRWKGGRIESSSARRIIGSDEAVTRVFD